MTDPKQNLTLQEVNAIETALEMAAAQNLATIRHLERLGETAAAEAVQMTQNFIAKGREALDATIPVRLPTAAQLEGAVATALSSRRFPPRDLDAAPAAKDEASASTDLNPTRLNQ